MLELRTLLRSDLPTVVGWLSQPHVAQWWGSGSTVEEEVASVFDKVAGEYPSHVLLATADGEPVGFCQWFLCSDFPEYARQVRAKDGDIGIDYAIGLPTRAGQGFGTSLVAALIKHIHGIHPLSDLIADPPVEDSPSCRILEKNGFVLQHLSADDEQSGPATAVYRLAADIRGADAPTV